MRTLFFSLIVMLALPAYSMAKGHVIGPVYDIQEPDMLVWIKQRLEHMQETGELHILERQAKQRAERSIQHPQAVVGIQHTKTPRRFLVDPSIVVDRVIQDHQGRVIAMPGTKVNPFSFVHMSKHLVFIDGESKQQQKWALSMRKHYKGRIKIILVSGSPIDLMKQWKLRVYFDQMGRLTQKFHIKHVPAIVSQQGMKLLVSEVLPRVKS